VVTAAAPFSLNCEVIVKVTPGLDLICARFTVRLDAADPSPDRIAFVGQVWCTLDLFLLQRGGVPCNRRNFPAAVLVGR